MSNENISSEGLKKLFAAFIRDLKNFVENNYANCNHLGFMEHYLKQIKTSRLLHVDEDGNNIVHWITSNLQKEIDQINIQPAQESLKNERISAAVDFGILYLSSVLKRFDLNLNLKDQLLQKKNQTGQIPLACSTNKKITEFLSDALKPQTRSSQNAEANTSNKAEADNPTSLSPSPAPIPKKKKKNKNKKKGKKIINQSYQDTQEETPVSKIDVLEDKFNSLYRQLEKMPQGSKLEQKKNRNAKQAEIIDFIFDNYSINYFSSLYKHTNHALILTKLRKVFELIFKPFEQPNTSTNEMIETQSTHLNNAINAIKMMAANHDHQTATHYIGLMNRVLNEKTGQIVGTEIILAQIESLQSVILGNIVENFDSINAQSCVAYYKFFMAFKHSLAVYHENKTQSKSKHLAVHYPERIEMLRSKHLNEFSHKPASSNPVYKYNKNTAYIGLYSIISLIKGGDYLSLVEHIEYVKQAAEASGPEESNIFPMIPASFLFFIDEIGRGKHFNAHQKNNFLSSLTKELYKGKDITPNDNMDIIQACAHYIGAPEYIYHLYHKMSAILLNETNNILSAKDSDELETLQNAFSKIDHFEMIDSKFQRYQEQVKTEKPSQKKLQFLIKSQEIYKLKETILNSLFQIQKNSSLSVLPAAYLRDRQIANIDLNHPLLGLDSVFDFSSNAINFLENEIKTTKKKYHAIRKKCKNLQNKMTLNRPKHEETEPVVTAILKREDKPSPIALSDLPEKALQPANPDISQTSRPIHDEELLLQFLGSDFVTTKAQANQYAKDKDFHNAMLVARALYDKNENNHIKSVYAVSLQINIEKKKFDVLTGSVDKHDRKQTLYFKYVHAMYQALEGYTNQLNYRLNGLLVLANPENSSDTKRILSQAKRMLEVDLQYIDDHRGRLNRIIYQFTMISKQIKNKLIEEGKWHNPDSPKKHPSEAALLQREINAYFTDHPTGICNLDSVMEDIQNHDRKEFYSKILSCELKLQLLSGNSHQKAQDLSTIVQPENATAEPLSSLYQTAKKLNILKGQTQILARNQEIEEYQTQLKILNKLFSPAKFAVKGGALSSILNKSAMCDIDIFVINTDEVSLEQLSRKGLIAASFNIGKKAVTILHLSEMAKIALRDNQFKLHLKHSVNYVYNTNQELPDLLHTCLELKADDDDIVENVTGARYAATNQALNTVLEPAINFSSNPISLLRCIHMAVCHGFKPTGNLSSGFNDYAKYLAPENLAGRGITFGYLRSKLAKYASTNPETFWKEVAEAGFISEILFGKACAADTDSFLTKLKGNHRQSEPYYVLALFYHSCISKNPELSSDSLKIKYLKGFSQDKFNCYLNNQVYSAPVEDSLPPQSTHKLRIFKPAVTESTENDQEGQKSSLIR